MADLRGIEAASEEVDSSHFSFYSDDEIKRISVKKITKSERLDAKNHPVPGGLLDPAMGPINDTDTCKGCGQHSARCPGHFGHIELRLNPSGMSDADKTTEAMARYAAALQKPFTQMHSWKLLKDEPKWEACIGAHSKLHVLNDDSSDAAAGGANGVGGPAESDVLASSGSKRPIGRDATKAARKKAATSSSSSEYISQMNDMWGNKLSLIKESHAKMASHHATMALLQEKKMTTERELEERRLALEERRLAMEASRLEMEKNDRESRMEMERSQAAKEERAEEERILSIELDKCSPALRLFYKRQQEQILAKYSLPPP